MNGKIKKRVLKVMKEIKRYMILLAIFPIEYIALTIDFYTGTLWGYILFLLLIALTIIYAENKGRVVILALIRLLGGVISYILIYLSSDPFILTDYFKPLMTTGLSITLSAVSILIIIVLYMYINNDKNEES